MANIGASANNAALLQQAVYGQKEQERASMLDRLFAFWFQRLVYPQIWEDPVIDMQAMGPVRLRDVDEAQALLVNLAKDLAAKGEIILVEEKAELMRKLGKKQLTLQLLTKLDVIPAALAAHKLALSPDGLELTFTYDSRAERTGITTARGATCLTSHIRQVPRCCF